MWLVAYGAESPEEVYWKMNLGNDISMPSVVKESLLGTNENYQANIDEIVRNTELNSLFRYHKKYNAKPRPQLLNDNFVQFFFQNELFHPVSKMNLHFLTGVKDAKFIPSLVANAVPFSSSKLPELLQLFGLNDKSTSAQIIEEAVTSCESKPIRGEQKSCLTSIPEIVTYAKSVVGNRVNVFSTEINNESMQEYTIEGSRKIQSERNMVCHKMVYPYAVFYCHTLSKTDAYQVSLIDGTGTKVRAVAVCHKDTSSWNSGHLAFKLLKVTPGDVPICHFLDADAMIWVPRDVVKNVSVE